MTPIRFDYYAIHPTEDRTTSPGGMIALEVGTGPLRTVLWDPIDRKWTFDRAGGALFLLDDRRSEAVTRIDRSQAERIASDVFRTVLPSEEELHRMSEEGEAQANAAPSGPWNAEPAGPTDRPVDGPGGVKMLSAGQLLALAERLARTRPLLGSVAPEEAAARVGWRICPDNGYADVTPADTGLGVGPCEAELWHADDGVGIDCFAAPVTDNIRTRWTAETVGFVRDAFAINERVMTTRYGEPTLRDPGLRPSIGWRLDDVTLTLHLGPTMVRLFAEPNDVLDRRAAEAALHPFQR